MNTKKMIFIMVMLFIVIGVFAACGASEDDVVSSSVVEESEEPKDKSKEIKEIDFDLLSKDLHDDLKIGNESEDYQFVQDYYVGLSDDGKTINITAVVDDSTDPEKALDFADTLVRRINANAQLQDSSIENPSQDTYGGLYDRYKALIGVARASQQNDQDAWLVFDSITSSDGPELNLQN